MAAKAMVPVEAPPSINRSRVARALTMPLQGRLLPPAASRLAVHDA
jgi:hypothetical protein